ncbi:hypothetical protein INT45_002396 [Circinella minor]|uniref:Reverse transcriptase domain-containing protein n=1 Tax=Circinella minor TaxID=1195481 RepID=A0A8H7VKT7_9FUNG|nr:hypothetical protein INT45_002396 [Circinella minor]
MRSNRKPTYIFSDPDVLQKATEKMGFHLSQVFGGERPNTHNTTRSNAFPQQQSFEHDKNDNPFPAEEIEYLITKMTPCKAPGNDHLTGAMLKPIVHSPLSTLSKFFKLCWNWSYVPTSFRTAQVVPIYKKADPTVAGNFRPISLTSVFHKILERCLLSKLLSTIKSLGISQGGFRHYRGALDQAFSLNMLIH